MHTGDWRDANSRHSEVPTNVLTQHGVGGWSPVDQRVMMKWLDKRIATKIEQRMHASVENTMDPSILAFQELIESDPVIYMGFHQMFEQATMIPQYNDIPDHKPKVKDYKTMLLLFNDILTTAPHYEDDIFVAFPISAILEYAMSTPAGFSMFTNAKVNQCFKDMFAVWAKFLTSPDSCYVLTTEDDGWFGSFATQAMPNFTQTYVCDPTQPHYGFTSWDDFFTRKFQPGVRPIEHPQDDIITSACESAVYNRAENVKERDSFWLKGQPYSLADMLNHDETYVRQFVGGTVYQAFLSATSYHRWHSPVNGVIVDVQHVPGTYYAESIAQGYDPEGQIASQAFLTQVAARAIVYIKADNEDIGLMCFMAVGMAEVSTCEATVNKGQRVEKGQEIGMFHFGGSTHCLIFGPQTKVTFWPDQEIGTDIPLNAPIATVSKAFRSFCLNS